MTDSDWTLAFLVGLLIGIPIGFIIYQLIAGSSHSMIIFERDEESNIKAIHYVRGSK